MKIDDESASTSSGYPVMPPASAKLFNSITNANTVEEFIGEINKCREAHSVMGTSELRSWIKVLNRLDEILENGVEKNEHSTMKCDYDPIVRKQVIDVVRFTVLLFESTSSRRVYRSFHHILDLLETIDMDILGEVLRLLQTMGKRSKFLTTRVGPAEQKRLESHLTAIAQCWGSIKMTECVKKEPIIPARFPFIFTDGNQRKISIEKPTDGSMISLADYLAQLTPPTSLSTLSNHSPLNEDQYRLFSTLRMLVNFETRSQRLKCLVARLLSVSTLIYCCCQSDENPVRVFLHNEFVDELIAILIMIRYSVVENEYELLDQIHVETLSTLCNIVNYEKESKIPKISHILESLSAGSYHGYLAFLTRQLHLKQKNLDTSGNPSCVLANSFFNFLNLLAGIGAETLIRSGIRRTLLNILEEFEPLAVMLFLDSISETLVKFGTIDTSEIENGINLSNLLATIEQSNSFIDEALQILQNLSPYAVFCTTNSWILIIGILRKVTSDRTRQVLTLYLDKIVPVRISDLFLNSLPLEANIKQLIRNVCNNAETIHSNECSQYSKTLYILLMRYCTDNSIVDLVIMEKLAVEAVIELFQLELDLFEKEKRSFKMDAILSNCKNKQSVVWKVIDELASKKPTLCTSNKIFKRVMIMKDITFPAVQQTQLFNNSFNDLSVNIKKRINLVSEEIAQVRNAKNF